jgi:hypothetical protein
MATTIMISTNVNPNLFLFIRIFLSLVLGCDLAHGYGKSNEQSLCQRDGMPEMCKKAVKSLEKRTALCGKREKRSINPENATGRTWNHASCGSACACPNFR